MGISCSLYYGILSNGDTHVYSLDIMLDAKMDFFHHLHSSIMSNVGWD